MLEIGERVIRGPGDAIIGPEDTSLGVDSLVPVALDLPPAADLDSTPGTRRLRIRDSGGHAGTAPITISAIGATIDGLSSVVINQSFGGVVLEWEGVRWHILSLSQLAVTLAGDTDGPSDNNTTRRIQRNPLASGLLGVADTGKGLFWTGAQWLAQFASSAGLPPLTRTLFVDSGTSTALSQQDGQQWSPFASEAQLGVPIGASPVNSQWNVVLYRPSGDGFSIPASRLIVLQGGSQAIAAGAVIWFAGDPIFASILSVRGVHLPGITILDDAGGASSGAILAIENALIFGSISQSGGSSVVHLLIGGTVGFLSALPLVSSQIFGNVDVKGFVLAQNTVFNNGCAQVTCFEFYGHCCSSHFNLDVVGVEVELFQHSFYQQSTFTFLTDEGTLTLDSRSTQSWFNNGNLLVNGRLAPWADQQSPGWTLPGGIIEGQICYVSGSDAASLAIADAAIRSQMFGIYANRLGMLLPGGPHDRYVRFDGGLTLAPGEVWFLSTSEAGSATNVDPQIASVAGTFTAPGGYIRNVSRYATNGVALCSFNPLSIGGPWGP